MSMSLLTYCGMPYAIKVLQTYLSSSPLSVEGCPKPQRVAVEFSY